MIKSLFTAYPKPKNKACYRQYPEDFQVYEALDFIPCGEGEHLYLYIEKRNTNTHWLADELARRAGVKSKDVGYAGRKDRFAITRQWFSLQIPASKNVDLSIFHDTEFQLIDSTRHTQKLRKGAVLFNKFRLQLRECEGSFIDFKTRVELLTEQGYPNYFGAQRFGHNGANVDKAKAMLSGSLRINDRNKRSIYLSAARSYLFNKVLSKRIELGLFKTLLKGDVLWDSQQRKLIDSHTSISNLKKHIAKGKIIITGPLPGDGVNLVGDEALLMEAEVLESESELCKGISDSRIEWHRRANWIFPQEVEIAENEDGFVLGFSLSKGAFATSLLRELIEIKNNE